MNRLIPAAARAAALAGGAVLIALTAMTCLSIAGRAGLTLSGIFDLPGIFAQMRPVRGDYELIEAGTAIAICAFLPRATLAGAHARVDLLGGLLSPRADRAMNALWDWLMAGTLALLTWKLAEGMVAKRAAQETSFLLQLPIWWAYAACLAGMIIALATAIWVAAGHHRRQAPADGAA